MVASNSVAGEFWISKHRIAAFFCLAYLLSWYPWLIALVRGRVSGPNPLGPLVAAFVIAAVAGGKPEVRLLLRRLARVAVGWRWYAFIIALPVLVCLVAAISTCVITRASIALPPTDKLRELPARFIFIFFFVGLGEEPGWRGFALPNLQRKNSPVFASLILAPRWAIWHFPLFGNEFPLPIVPPFLLSLFGGTFVQTWLFNRTRESVFIQMLLHATVNSVSAGLVFPLFHDRALMIMWWVYGALWLGAGIALLCLRDGPTSRPNR